MMPVSRKTFYMHRIEFAEMLSAIKEIEAINRVDIANVTDRNKELIEYIKKNHDKVFDEDVMYK
jgi:hypothetical protein